jgi:hypothetical protein
MDAELPSLVPELLAEGDMTAVVVNGLALLPPVAI